MPLKKIEIPIPTYFSEWYPLSYYPTVIKPNTFRSLGTAALDITPVSYTIDSPINYVMSDDIYFSYPLTPMGPLISNDYDTVDDDIEMRSKITKYFFEKLFNNWLFTENNKLLRYYKVKNTKISKLSNRKDYEKNIINSNDDKKKIISYILNNVYDKYDLKLSLKKFIRKTGTKWFELKDNEVFVKEQITKDIKKK